MVSILFWVESVKDGVNRVERERDWVGRSNIDIQQEASKYPISTLILKEKTINSCSNLKKKKNTNF